MILQIKCTWIELANELCTNDRDKLLIKLAAIDWKKYIYLLNNTYAAVDRRRSSTFYCSLSLTPSLSLSIIMKSNQRYYNFYVHQSGSRKRAFIYVLCLAVYIPNCGLIRANSVEFHSDISLGRFFVCFVLFSVNLICLGIKLFT